MSEINRLPPELAAKIARLRANPPLPRYLRNTIFTPFQPARAISFVGAQKLREISARNSVGVEKPATEAYIP